MVSDEIGFEAQWNCMFWNIIWVSFAWLRLSYFGFWILVLIRSIYFTFISSYLISSLSFDFSMQLFYVKFFLSFSVSNVCITNPRNRFLCRSLWQCQFFFTIIGIRRIAKRCGWKIFIASSVIWKLKKSLKSSSYTCWHKNATNDFFNAFRHFLGTNKSLDSKYFENRKKKTFYDCLVHI